MSHELATGESSSKIVDVERSNSEDAIIGAEITDGAPTFVGAGFRKSDPPT